jgi:hypothetical protein
LTRFYKTADRLMGKMPPIIALVVLLVFGPKRLPELGHSLGERDPRLSERDQGERPSDRSEPLLEKTKPGVR